MQFADEKEKDTDLEFFDRVIKKHIDHKSVEKAASGELGVKLKLTELGADKTEDVYGDDNDYVLRNNNEVTQINLDDPNDPNRLFKMKFKHATPYNQKRKWEKYDQDFGNWNNHGENPQEVYNFVERTLEEQNAFVKKQVEIGEKLPKLEHPKIDKTSTYDIMKTLFPEKRDEYGLDFIITGLSKQFPKLSFSWGETPGYDSNLMVSWSSEIVSPSITKTTFQASDIKKLKEQLHRMTKDNQLVEKLVVTLITEELSKVF
jgi:hypothetical protein